MQSKVFISLYRVEFVLDYLFKSWPKRAILNQAFHTFPQSLKNLNYTPTMYLSLSKR
jgi:hypothetical protein